MLVIIEGVDGTGKTTLIEGIKTIYAGRPVFVFNFSYPKIGEIYQDAAFAQGEYAAASRMIKEILTVDPRALVICDRFHLGEYAYGIAKRKYPFELARRTFEIETYLLKEIGVENIKLVILAVSDSEVAAKRSDRPGEYLESIDEYTLVNHLYGECPTFTKLPVDFIMTDDLDAQKVLSRVLNFMVNKDEAIQG